jgi:hypothetical protein
MAYFPASCDYHCKDCSQNKCGWCAFHDHPTRGALAITANQSEIIEPYNYSTTITGYKEDKK